MTKKSSVVRINEEDYDSIFKFFRSYYSLDPWKLSFSSVFSIVLADLLLGWELNNSHRRPANVGQSETDR